MDDPDDLPGKIPDESGISGTAAVGLELNSAEVALTQTKLAYNQSIYDYLVAKANLDLVMGVEEVKE